MSSLRYNFSSTYFVFNDKMMSKMEDITKKLDDLAARKGKLQLGENHNAKGMIPVRPPTSSLVNEDDVFGRKEDKKKIIKLLLSNDDATAAGKVYSVIPIVGMGGIGKTTLAKLVYNDDSIKDHFDLKAWVCVSDDFDIIRITKAILQSVAESCDANDLNSLQVKLKEKLSKKKFLLVLDDIWNENYQDWLELRCPFDAGLPGSKIIVTTRSSSVSSIMRTVSSDHLLQKLSDDDSLRMFAHHALGARDFSGYPDFIEIGVKIMKKCNGLPLATITVGGLLRTKLNPEAWKGVLESGIWNLTDDKSRMDSALRLSYFHLPSQLKQCFAYCSLVPKDCEFEKEEMVLLWVAEGFLHQANTKVSSEDLGRQNFEELVSRSFFQVFSMNGSQFVMHDLINDLVQSVAGDLFFRMEEGGLTKYTERTRHSSYIMGPYDGLKKFDTFPKAEHLRTFLPFSMERDYNCYLSNDVVSDLLPKLRRLRVLSLKRYNITEIPESIGNLLYLRYLNFSDTWIKELPNSICNLYNLESLILRFCKEIGRLPSKIENLVNLCHLDIKGAESIKEMPSGIGKLTNLQTLSKFIVGGGDGLDISAMKNLSNLKGEISISNLQNVDEAQLAACEAVLSGKTDLDSLELKWCDDFNQNLRKKEVEGELLRLLQPHKDLKVLTIKYYAGTPFPTWVGDPSFKNLQSLNLEDCPNCTILPTVGKLQPLKDVYIKGMSSVISVGNEFYGGNWQNVFPSVETLHFEDMPEWKEWKSCEVEEQGRKFPRLRELYIKNCPKLIGTLPNDLHGLETLEICGCGELVFDVSNLPMLCMLKIDGCKELVFGSSTNIWSLKEIILNNISKFACLEEETIMSKSVKVENLQIDGCEELSSLWQTQTKWGWLEPLRCLRTLRFKNIQQVLCIGAAKKEEMEELSQLEIPCNIEDVTIANCERLEKLSKTFNSLTCLKVLMIEKCHKLVSIYMPLTLKTLEIWDCESLQYLVEDGNNTNFSSTSLLESLDVHGCRGLQSLSASGKLPAALKRLVILECPSLEVIAGEFGDNACLEYIELENCENIKYLSHNVVNKLNRLQWIRIMGCPNLICFPNTNSGVTTTPNLIPTTLSSLDIWSEPNVSKALMEWEGFHTFTSLTSLAINGSNCTDTMSFPPSQEEQIGMNVMNMKLPSSLIDLTISYFINLRKLSSSGFQSLISLRRLSIWNCQKLKSLPQNLTSLQSLDIHYCPNFKSLPQNLTSLQSLEINNCPKLKSLPKMEMLPSLMQLEIRNCPELQKRCKRDKGKPRSNISHIPEVDID